MSVPTSVRLLTLAERARAGDEGAREQLLLHLAPIVARYLRRRLGQRMVPSDLLDDLLQEALADIAAGIDRCLAREDRQLVAWSLTVTWHAAIDHISSPRSGIWLLRNSQPLDGQPTEPADEDGEALDEVSRARRLLYRLAVEAQEDVPATLPPLLWYRLVRGDSWEEIGRRLGTTPAAAKRRFQRGRGALRRAIARRSVHLTERERELLRREMSRWR